MEGDPGHRHPRQHHSLCEWLGITTGREGNWTGEGKQAPGQEEAARLLLLHGTVSDRGMNGLTKHRPKLADPAHAAWTPALKLGQLIKTPEPAFSSVKEGCGANKKNLRAKRA